MKSLAKVVFSVVSAAMLLAAAGPVFAATPLFSVTNSGNNGIVSVTVSNADAYAQITLNRRQGTTLWTTITNFGQTDGNGHFSQSLSLGSDGSNNPVEQYVVVNGQQSSIVQTYPNGNNGCSYNCGSPTGISLSQNTVSINVNQNASVTVNSYNGGTAYVSSNTNPSVASVIMNGSVATIYGIANGSATITLCVNNAGQCASVYVTVTGAPVTGAMTLSQSNLNLNAGQNATVTIYNSVYNGGNYYISSNTNANVATATVNGSVITVYAVTAGSTSMVVCANNSSQCATLYVSVSGSYNNGNISFSQTSVAVNQYQSATVTIYNNNNSNSYYISSNSNSSVATASISGNTLYINGLYAGTTVMSICQNNGSCGSITVTVSGSSNNSGNLYLSQSTLNLTSGQNSSVTVSGNNVSGNSLYISNNSNSSVATVTVSGATLNVYANGNGSTTVTVCQSGTSYCATLYVTVNGGVNNTNTLYFSTTSLPAIVLGQYYSNQIQVYGGVLPYTYTVTSGNLPAGLSLSTGGLLSGTVYYANSANFTVRVTDAYGRSATANFTLNGNGSVLGSSTYTNGNLISEGNTVYVIYKNTKTAFGNRAAFEGLGFNFSQVTSAGYSGIPDSGYIISTANAAHPWGSWVKSGSTIYFVHELGLIPVTDYNTFINNGGQDRLVVQANSYDFTKQMLSVMVYGDARLK